MHRGHVGGYTIVKEKVVTLNSGGDGNDVTVWIHLEAIFEIELMWLLADEGMACVGEENWRTLVDSNLYDL